jgi:uncharacterized protein YunC (DUF1805 family)
MTKTTRVLFFVTHPNSSNGYSLCGYELAKYLAKKEDIALTIYGFQNFHKIGNNHRDDYPKNVYVYDAWVK